VPQRGEVEREVIASLIEGQSGQVRHVAAQVLGEVMQHRPRRAGGGRAILQAEAVQGGDLEMLTHGEHGGFRSKDPIVIGVEDPAISCKAVRLAGPFPGIQRPRQGRRGALPH